MKILTFKDYFCNGVEAFRDTFNPIHQCHWFEKVIVVLCIPIAPFFWLYHHVYNDMTNP